jgi:hypothetical protein
MHMSRKTRLDPEAQTSVDMVKDLVEERGQHYGDPLENHQRIADLWSIYLGHTITAHDVAACMVLMKMSRMRFDPLHKDSYLDGIAYLSFAADFADQATEG